MTVRRATLLFVAALALGGCRGNVRAIEKSMEPTIRSGDKVTLDEDAYADRPPAQGDIVGIRAPEGAERERCGAAVRPGSPCRRPTPDLADDLFMIKRVIAGPGQRVAIDGDGGAIVDGRRLDEPYVQPCAPADECALPRAIRIPRDHWFVLGDNRPYSSDSRFWGPVPTRAIDGMVDPARPSSQQP